MVNHDDLEDYLIICIAEGDKAERDAKNRCGINLVGGIH